MRCICRSLRIILIFTFLLGNFRGYMALWEDNDPDPKQIFPVRITALPAADQEILCEGIQVRNQKALDRLLEKYLP